MKITALLGLAVLLSADISAQSFSAPGTLTGYQPGAAPTTVQPVFPEPVPEVQYRFPEEPIMRAPENPWNESSAPPQEELLDVPSYQQRLENPWAVIDTPLGQVQTAPPSGLRESLSTPRFPQEQPRVNAPFGGWSYQPPQSSYYAPESGAYSDYPGQSYDPYYSGFPQTGFQEVTPGLYGPMDPGLYPGNNNFSFPMNPWSWF